MGYSARIVPERCSELLRQPPLDMGPEAGRKAEKDADGIYEGRNRAETGEPKWTANTPGGSGSSAAERGIARRRRSSTAPTIAMRNLSATLLRHG